LGTLDPALNVITKLEKDKYMEIITVLVSIVFAICLAALAITPTLIGVYLELRAQKRHGTQQNVPKFAAAYLPPVPFNSQIFLRGLGGLAKTQVTESGGSVATLGMKAAVCDNRNMAPADCRQSSARAPRYSPGWRERFLPLPSPILAVFAPPERKAVGAD
jgi:hypothetical protein